MFTHNPPKTEQKAHEEKKDERLLVALNKVNQPILNAIKWKKKPFEFSPEKLDVITLERIAKYTNCATLHCSGNCCPLSMALLYNLKVGKTELKIKNTFPPFTGCDQFATQQIIFSKALSVSGAMRNIDELSKNLLWHFGIVGEKYFIVAVSFKVLGKVFGHGFNAVILDKEEKPEVIFVDAWKTSKYIYTTAEMGKRYKDAISFHLFYHSGPVAKLKNPKSVESKTDDFEATSIYINPFLF